MDAPVEVHDGLVFGRRWLPALVGGVILVSLAVTLFVWARRQIDRPCGWLDSQGFACGEPFTAKDAKEGKVEFDLVVVEDDKHGDNGVKFAFVNHTDAERSVTWRDVQLVRANGERVKCFWGDDSYLRDGALPGERTLAQRSCGPPEDGLILLYRNIEVARLMP